MYVSGWPIALLLFHLFETASSKEDLCPLMISPSRMVVRFGDPVSANCSLPRTCVSTLGWDVSAGADTLASASYLVWKVHHLTEWSVKPICFTLSEIGEYHYSQLDLTVYQPPVSVSIHMNFSGPLLENHQYTVQCHVQDVAPAENLTVTFYRGQMALGPPQFSTFISRTPVTEIFTQSFITSREDDGEQYWCEAKLELGPEGPQPPPVVRSQYLTATVHFGPDLLCPQFQQVREGEPLSCEVTGNPSPEVTWLRNGQTVAPPIYPSRAYAGEYTLIAAGAVKQIEYTLEVEILTARGTSNLHSWHFLVTVMLIQSICWL
ncbi:intercellular adhesion molecule 1-like [Lampris incognitus]|uniref:intercellular adhesion molecule 1-like n=1 Tax=Lampris incognitus TaxID=2546036 RepID=UPI0024B53CAE|nr:intercellular adhesion molecule 1-like [Lampris incognitus]